MKISVITSVFNESIDVIKLCIDSVLNQSIKNFEYIIVDDNPNSLKLYNFLKREANKDTRIQILRNDTNLGLVKSLNRGLNYSTGDYIARVDADDISKKSRLENQLEFLKKNKLDFVCSNAKIIDENGKTLHNKALGNKKIVSQKIIRCFFYKTNFAVHSSWFAKRKVFQLLSSYRDVDYAEDYDFILRMLQRGIKIGYQPEVVVVKRIRENSITKRNAYRQYITSMLLIEGASPNIIKSKIQNLNVSIVNRVNDFSRLFDIFNMHRSIFNFVKLILCIFSSKELIKYIFWNLNGKIIRKIV